MYDQLRQPSFNYAKYFNAWSKTQNFFKIKKPVKDSDRSLTKPLKCNIAPIAQALQFRHFLELCTMQSAWYVVVLISSLCHSWEDNPGIKGPDGTLRNGVSF